MPGARVITSYAQNFEDVMLWRALHHIENGFYIDIGAQHPIIDSVSKAFFDHGWRGLHVEPIHTYASLLREDRPDEIVLQAAVAARAGLLSFYEIPGGGLSTARHDIAIRHQNEIGCDVIARSVTCVSLDDVLAITPREDVHWLKIDVEGFEKEALSGWIHSPKRPWILLIESTYPNTQIETFDTWEAYVLHKGYFLAYTDGLNRYYLSEQHADLKAAFRYPPNVFDNFQLSGTATALTTHLCRSYETRLSALQQEAAEAKSDLASLSQSFKSSESTAHDQERLLTKLIEQSLSKVRQDAQTHLIELVNRERAFSEQLSELSHQGALRDSELTAKFSAREADFRLQSSEREAQLRTEFLTLLTQAQTLQADTHRRLEELRDATAQRVAEVRIDSQIRLDQALDRERRLVERLAEAAWQSASREGELHAQHAAREAALRAQLSAHETELRAQLSAREADLTARTEARERGLTAQLHQAEAATHHAQLQGAEIRAQLEALQSGRLALEGQLQTHKELIARLSCELDAIRRSWIWRLAHRLRSIPLLPNASLPISLSPRAARPEESDAVSAFPSSQPRAVPEPPTSSSHPPPISRTSPVQHGAVDQMLRLGGEAFVRSAYRAILARDPDPAGLHHYLSALRCGQRKTQILRSLAKSAEASARSSYLDLQHLSDEAFIDAVYQRILGRRPDPVGRAHYLTLLRKHRSRWRVIRNITKSPEALRHNADALAFKRHLEALIRQEGALRAWCRSRGRAGRLERRVNQLENWLSETQVNPSSSALVRSPPLAAQARGAEAQPSLLGDASVTPSVFESLDGVSSRSPETLFNDLANRILASREATAFTEAFQDTK